MGDSVLYTMLVRDLEMIHRGETNKDTKPLFPVSEPRVTILMEKFPDCGLVYFDPFVRAPDREGFSPTA
jgi:hypothetical protein